MTDSGNAAQVRMVAEQVADAAIKRFTQEYPLPPPKAEIPAPLKWAAAIVATLFTTGVAGLAFWLVSSVGSMQVTLGRMDERMQQDITGQRVAENQKRIEKLEERVTSLEQGKVGK